MTREHAYKLREMMHKGAISLDDSDALDAVELFPVWAVGVDYTEGKRVRDGGELFKCKQPHTSQSDWRPSITPALWQKVEKPGQGDTPDNPIPWSWGLKIYKNKYYIENDIIYIGIRNSDTAIFADLSALIGNYVDIYKEE